MNLYAIFLALLLLSAGISLVLMAYAIRYRVVPGALPFACLLGAEFIWAIGYFFELEASHLAAKVVWDNLQFLGSDGAALSTLLFALAYTKREAIVRRFWPLLCLPLLLNVFIVWTDPFHHLIRATVELNTAGFFPVLSYVYGPWMWLLVINAYVLICIAFGVLITYAIRTQRPYKLQALAVVVGTATPFIGTILTVFGLVPIAAMAKLDITPITFALANPIIAWGIFRYRLFDLVPIARGLLIEQMRDGVLVVDAQQRVVDSNPSAQRLLGRRAATLIGTNVVEVLPVVGAMLDAGPEQYPLQVELCLNEDSDHSLYLDIMATPLQDRHQRLMGWLVALRDVTGSKQIEAALRKSEELLRATGRMARIGGWEIDLATQTPYWSEEVYRIHEVDPSVQPTLTQALNFFTPEARPIIQADAAAALREGTSWEIELPFITALGRRLWVHVQGIVETRNGKALRLRGTLQDITERKQIETALQQELAERKQTEAALARAKEAAEAADRAKSEFLANMSHEIRTPLNAIIGMTSLLIDTPLTENQHDYAETIRSSGKALLDIINDILDFSKIEAGKLELEQHVFNLHECIEDALDLVALPAAQKQLDLIYQMHDDVPETAMGDVTRLRQVLVNLLTNAVKFTEQGEVVLVARTESAASGSDASSIDLGARSLLHFEVRDTGIGIPAERIDRLFQSFSQIDSSITRRYGGTGLGLAISRHLVEIMGGALSVESMPGVGSIFRVTLPLEHPQGRAGDALPMLRPKLAEKHLLIVDDNATSRQTLAAQVSGWGLHAHTVESGAQALEWVAQGRRADLVLLDRQMPEMDGIATARSLRTELADQPTALVLISSSYDQHNAEEQALFDAIITRPVKPAQLHATLNNLLVAAPVAAPPHVQPTETAVVPNRAQLRVLLAEDNPVNQKVMRHMLSKLGYQADVAADGREVLEAIRRQPYDVVLMDVQMPHIDGVTATRIIRSLDSTIVQPQIIALTANALAGDRERYLAAGMDGYISKPVRLETLETALDEHLHTATTPVVAGATSRRPPSAALVLDRSVLARLQDLLGGQGRATVLEVIALFVRETPLLIEQLEQASASADARKVEQVAHSLRSSSYQIGAQALALVCADLEEHARRSDPALASRVAPLRSVYTQTEQELLELANS